MSKKKLLEAILQKYGGCNIDLGAVEQELDILEKAALARFNDSWARYGYLKSSGAPLGKRMERLAEILRKYRGWQIDLEFVKQEQRDVRKAIHSEFDASWDYYGYLRKTGGSTASRKEYLEMILKKYRGYIHNLELVKRELKDLAPSNRQ